MTKVIITAIGSAGDVHPLLGIGAALAARGHEVVFCTHPPFAEAVSRQGFAFVPIGTAAEYEAAMANPALWHPRTSFRTLWAVIAPTLRPHFDALAALIDNDTVLVGTLWAFSARLMQELYRVPFVSVQVSPSTLLSAHAPPTHPRLTIPRGLPLAVKTALLRLIERQVLDKVCGPALNALRTELALAPARRIFGEWLHSTDGVLCLFPEWFAQAQPDWPAPRCLAGFPLFNDTGVHASDPQLDAFLAAGERPVVFTAGSTLIDQARYTAAVSAALMESGLRGILLTPDAPRADADTAVASADGLADAQGVLLKRRYIPLQKLLPRCRALVHHGGIGTAALAYAAGIPQIVTPFAHDQFDNAQRVVVSGCGVRLDKPLLPQALARALRHLLSSPSIATQCGRVQDRLASSPDGCEAAARYIEGFMPTGMRAQTVGRASLPAFAGHSV
ncbi:glycosyl transferase family 1 [Paraburkholderia caffeinilytica]|uniref:UDP-glucoronosyl and UDP-glucosyl transferase n=1 Tax=Paraburkholderia caffeinilytica TaxID=1761016 RepID=A0ABQ1NB47_9BURK|nr:nucleotide disphospho-sugar-binding domain-containing protein [Paraburkholderia caffeinilytica]AXL49028.1 glycosyl transferase family 1 [Paraburkholderia caffeinilytica]GGC55960.1 UDP-glucoronosyl and UDP-glucosyl transferase [Paraburkholderia caffeinilytica]CAB3785629.1 Glycosyltransferase GtfC [Paraburkholderia caffeinilytica]